LLKTYERLEHLLVIPWWRGGFILALIIRGKRYFAVCKLPGA
jgi:hypothetical protein